MRLQKQNLRIFETSTLLKGVFSAISLSSILFISIYALFQIKDIPFSGGDVQKTAWILSIVSVVWYGGTYLNYNLHISENDKFTSYLFAFTLNAYLIFFVIFNINKTMNGWTSVKGLFWWVEAIFIYDILWKTSIAITEYKTRPYFIKKFIAKFIFSSGMYILITLGGWSIYQYLILGKTYDYLYWKNVLVWFFGGWIIILSFTLLIYTYSRYSQFGSAEEKINRKNSAWNIFVWLTSITVWSIFNFKWGNWTLKEFILIGIGAFSALIILIAYIFKLRKKTDRTMLMISVSSLLIVNVSAFLFAILWKADLFNVIIIVSIFLSIFQFSIVTLSIKLPRMFVPLNYLLATLMVLEIIASLAGNQLIGEIKVVEIREIMIGIILFISSMLALVTMISQLRITFKINSNINKLVSLEKDPNQIITLKGVKNVK